MSVPRTLARCAALLGTATVLAACGSGDKAPGSGAEQVKFPPIDTSQPAAAAGTPGEVVVRLWVHLRDGMVPLALNAFEPDVVDGVGRETFVGGLNVMRDIVTPLAPTIVETEDVEPRRPPREGTSNELAVVHAEGRGSQGARLRATFLLKRTPFGWSVVYDSVMDSALRTYVATVRQDAVTPSERLGEKRAVQAAASIARQYQSVANDLIGRSF